MITNTQIYLLIGVPIIFNFGIMIALFTIINTNINHQFTAFRSEMSAKFDSLAVRIQHLEK